MLNLYGVEFEKLVGMGLPHIVVDKHRMFPPYDMAIWITEKAESHGIRRSQLLPPPPSRIVKAREVEIELGVCRQTIHRYVAAGMPHRRTPGGHLRFDLAEVHAWRVRPPVQAAPLGAAATIERIRAIHAAEARGREIAILLHEREQRIAQKKMDKKRP